jgi:hypothetical protein
VAELVLGVVGGQLVVVEGVVERRPVTWQELGSRRSRTSPVTNSWLASMKASRDFLRGLNQRPS